MMLVVIPARGGSKGVPGKNIKVLGSKPLIQHTIEEARKVFSDESIIVSTDSPEIKRVAEETGLGVPFLRPGYLATDEAGTYEVLLHAIDFMESRGSFPEALILLQPTSPFRQAHHIREAMKLFTSDLEMLVSVKEAKNPFFTLRDENDQGYLVRLKEPAFVRRQEIPKLWELNGAIYIINIAALKMRPLNQFSKVKKYVMDEVSSLDIDTLSDWKMAECIFLNG